MKTRISIVLLCAFTWHYSFSQCTPAAGLPAFGVYPPSDSLACVERGFAYSQDVQFYPPASVNTQLGTITFISMTINSVHGLPDGIGYDCNPSNCVFPGGATSCLNLNGTTNDPVGNYPVKFTVTFETNFGPFGPADLDSLLAANPGIFDPPNYSLNVINQGDPCTAVVPALSVSISGDLTFCPGESTILTANASNATGNVIYFWSNSDTSQSIVVSSAGNYSVTVVDQTGDATDTVAVTEDGTGCQPGQNGCSVLPSLTPSSCTPLQLPAPGFSDTSICVVQGQNTNEVLYFQNFSSISGITVEWLRIDSITNLPCGLTLALDEADNTYDSGENGCISLTGVTNSDAGLYELGLYITVKVSLLPNPISGEANALSGQFGGPDFGIDVIVNESGVPCGTIVTQVVVSGMVLSATGSGINTATVSATGNSAPSDITDATGSYSLTFNSGETPTVTPSKNNDVSTNNGLTTLDILLIRQHILNISLFSSPYKIIAADVNFSESVTTLDILLTRQVILQINPIFPSGELWIFTPHDYQFDLQNPFQFPVSRGYNSLASDQTGQDFIGMKLGDVNDSWNPNTPKAGAVGAVGLAMDEFEAMQGEEIAIPVKAKDFKNITGYQFTLSWDPEVLELLDVQNRSLTGYYGMNRTKEGLLITSWDDEMAVGQTLSDDAVVFELRFKVVGTNGMTSEIKIGSELTSSEAYNGNLELLDIHSINGMVKVGTVSSVSNLASRVSNLSVHPNPFSNTTQIVFDLLEKENVIFLIHDMVGKEVWRMRGDFSAGRNSIQWTGDDTNGHLLSTGLYHLKMTAGNISEGRKILISGR